MTQRSLEPVLALLDALGIEPDTLNVRRFGPHLQDRGDSPGAMFLATRLRR
jgi:hypothetical protein